ncbi:MAG: peptidylprolyl isomerase [Bacteroidota bacterium]
MRKLFLYSGIIIFIFLLGCSPSSPTLATIAEEQYSLSDFNHDYNKNAVEGSEKGKPSREDAEKFLNLIIDYKLKIKEANAQNLQNDSSVQKEREKYRASVAQAYVIEKELVEPSAKLFYERRKEVLHVHHIFFGFPGRPYKGDTLAVYNKALKVIEALNHNASFDSLALRYSEDPNVRKIGADLGNISAGQKDPSFEDACYNLHVGEYTKTPVLITLGYEILLLTSRRQQHGSLDLAHIVLKFKDKTAATDSALLDSARIIYAKINKGLPFEEAVTRYSADKNRAQGIIGTFEENDLFAFLLDSLSKVKTGGITNPIRFMYGYEIMKVIDRKPLASYAATENSIKYQYHQSRFSYDYKIFVDQIRNKFIARPDSAISSEFVSSIDSTKSAEHWRNSLPAEFLEKTLLRCGTHTMSVRDAIEQMQENHEFQRESFTPQYLIETLDKLEENFSLSEYSISRISHYPVLDSLLNEYADGLLLDKIEQEEVWKKIPVSDSLLHGYFEKHKENYRWSTRVNFAEIYVPTDSAANAIYKKIQQGKNFQELAEKNTTRPGYKEKNGVWGFQPVTANALSDRASLLAIDSVTPPFRYEEGWSLLKVIARDSAQAKTFEEAKPEVLSEYQNEAAERRKIEWVKELRIKYPVAIKSEILGEAVK